jgi:hypothetical protein
VNLLKWMGCLFRNYHRRMVPDLALLTEDGDTDLWAGHCRDCGSVKWRTGAYWQKQRDKPSLPAGTGGRGEGQEKGVNDELET